MSGRIGPFIAAVGMCVLVGVAGCGASTLTTGAAKPKAPIKIGVVVDLTGANSTFGQDYYEDARILFSQVNKSGGIRGHKLQVYYVDDNSNAADAVQAAKKLIYQNGVKLLFGGTFTPVALALDALANQTNVLFYTPASTAPTLTTPLQKYIFAVNQTQAISSKAIAKLTHSMAVHKIGMIEETDAYGENSLSTANAALAPYGLKVSDVATIAADAIDATSQILQLKSAGDQVILLGTTIDPATAAIKAEVQQGVKTPLVAYGGGAAPSIDQLLASSPTVTYYAITPLACPLDPAPGACVKQFVRQYAQADPTGTPSVWTAEGYAATAAFIDGLKDAKTFTPAGVAAGLEGMGPVSSPLLPYPITFSASSHLGVHNTYLYGFSGGKLAFFGNDVHHNALH